MRILIVGLSTRSFAESAAAGRHQVVTLDYFGDRDQRALVENYALLRDFALPFTAGNLLRASRNLEFDAVAYTSNLENHPRVVAGLAKGRTLFGNGPAVLRQVRDWRTLRAFCHQAGLRFPMTLLPGEEQEADPQTGWLRKPVRSGGGHGIRLWTGEPLDRAHLLQATILGQPISAAFVADGQRCVLLGLTEQLIGREELGTRGWTWCGNILPLAAGAKWGSAVRTAVEEMAARLTHRFGLLGVNGLDLMLAEGDPRPYLVEVNPRYSASMELMEQAYGLSIFTVHLDAMAGRLPAFSLADHPSGPYFGKAIVYARRTVTMPETEAWAERGRRDVPFPGERIQAGHPVCTVFAQGETRQACWDELLAGAAAVHHEIGNR